MKRLIFMVVVALTATVTAQQPNTKLRSRWGSTSQQAGATPLVTITGPTLGEDLVITGNNVTISGVAESTSQSPIVNGSWECPLCTVTSGIMTVGLDGNFQSAGGAGGTIVLHDPYVGSTTELALVTPDVGSQWSSLTTGASNPPYQIQRNVGGWAQLNSSVANGARFTMIGAPSPALSGTNYDIYHTLQSVTSADADDGVAIMNFGGLDAGNFCTVVAYGAGANPDLYLLKWVGGNLLASLDTADIAPANGDVFKTEMRGGSNISVKRNDIEVMSSTGTTCTAGSQVGWGIGSFRNVAGDDASSRWHLLNFTVVDQDVSSGAIIVPTGVTATITVEMCDGLGACGYDFLRVSSETLDSQDPETTITGPVNTPSYGTSQAAITISGTVTDNVAPVSCSLSSVGGTISPSNPACSLSGAAVDSKSVLCPSVTQTNGLNQLILTCLDAQGNSHSDQLDSNYQAADTTRPVVTITTNGGNGVGNDYTTTSQTGTITGTCFDAVGCTQMFPACNTCTLGTVTGGTGTGTNTWTIPVTWGVSANTFTMNAQDQAGNQMVTPDSIVVTYNPPLDLVTTGFTVVEDVALNAAHCMTATGGSGTKTWSKLSGTYPAGVTLNTSTGCFTGTPTTPESQSLVIQVSDSSGSPDSGTVVFTVQAVGSGPHAYYESLRTNPACFKAYSLRPLAGSTTPVDTTIGVADCAHDRYINQIPNGSLYPTYNYVTYPTLAGDTDVEKQDATKIVIPVFVEADTYLADSNPSTGYPALTQDIDATQTTFTMNWDGVGHENQQGMLVDNEVMQQTGWNATTNTMTVIRGAFGTPKTSHSTGAAVRRSGNGLHDATRRLPINTDGSVSATYLFTWDTYWTSDYRNTGLTSHKMNQISSWDINAQMMEYKPLYSGGSNIDYSSTTDVASASMRWYVQSLTPGYYAEPGEPFRDENNAVSNGLLIKPSTWTRVWLLIEANSETDTSKFVNTGQTLITTGGIDATTTEITMSHDLGGPTPSYIGGPLRANTSNPFTVGAPSSVLEGPNQTHPGRRIRIGSEIMTIVSCSVCTGNTRTLTVRRNQDGTTAATHAYGAAIQAIEDYVTVWMADENQNPRMIINRLSAFIPINRSTSASVTEAVAAKQRGSMATWWIEYNTSTGQTTQQRVNQLSNARGGDLVSYQRNFIILKNPASCTSTNCSAYVGTNRPLR